MLYGLTLDYDFRIEGYCLTVKATYGWFLDKTTDSENNLSIQRKIIKDQKSYATLRADLKRGCILPPLVLSLQDLVLPPNLDQIFDSGSDEDQDAVVEVLTNLVREIDPSSVQIIDGLQRTNALRQTLDELEGEEKETFLQRPVRLEAWLNLEFNAIAYRMLLLNAGQKPMSMKHQVEILSIGLADDLQEIDGITVLRGPDQRRSQPGQFQLAKLSQGFQAWLQGAPNVDISNTVMQELLADSAIETLGASLKQNDDGGTSDSFKQLVKWLVDADRKAVEANPGENEFLQFFGSDTVLLGICAQVGLAERNPGISPNLWQTMQSLIDKFDANNKDPLGILKFNEIRSGINPGKKNVGVATRELVFSAFQQYLFGQGNLSMDDCWVIAGASSRS